MCLTLSTCLLNVIRTAVEVRVGERKRQLVCLHNVFRNANVTVKSGRLNVAASGSVISVCICFDFFNQKHGGTRLLMFVSVRT